MEDCLNSYMAIGRIRGTPDIRYVGTGTAVCKFTLAVPYGKTSMYVYMICWEGLAEKAHAELRDGMRVKIEGRLSIRSYQDKNGIKKYSTEIVVNEYSILEAGYIKRSA